MAADARHKVVDVFFCHPVLVAPPLRQEQLQREALRLERRVREDRQRGQRRQALRHVDRVVRVHAPQHVRRGVVVGPAAVTSAVPLHPCVRLLCLCLCLCLGLGAKYRLLLLLLLLDVVLVVLLLLGLLLGLLLEIVLVF